MNGQVKTLNYASDCNTNLDGEVNMQFTASTTDKVTGRMKAVYWHIHKDRWKHLKQINFPVSAKKPFIDILIGVDYSDLHASQAKIMGKVGEQIVRLTSLWWTVLDIHNNLSLHQRWEASSVEIIRIPWMKSMQH